MTTLNLTVPDMACSACAETITEAVQALDNAASVKANPQTKAVVVSTTKAPDEVKQAISDAGYTVEV